MRTKSSTTMWGFGPCLTLVLWCGTRVFLSLTHSPLRQNKASSQGLRWSQKLGKINECEVYNPNPMVKYRVGA